MSSDGGAITYDVNDLDICEPPRQLGSERAEAAALLEVPPVYVRRRRHSILPTCPPIAAFRLLIQADDFFNYWPSLALAITALCLFTVAAAVIGFMTERRKVYRFVHCIT